MRPAAVVQARTAAGRRAGRPLRRRPRAHRPASRPPATAPCPRWPATCSSPPRALDEITVHPRERWARVGAGDEVVPPRPARRPARPRRRQRLHHGRRASSATPPAAASARWPAPTASTPTRCARSRSSPATASSAGSRRTSNPDLFFALRGGKGAAGIVTALEIDLIELPTFYGGACFFAARRHARGDRGLAGLVGRAAVRRDDVDRDLPDAGHAGRARAARRPDDPVGAVPLDRARRRTASAGSPGCGRWPARCSTASACTPYPAIDLVHTDPLDPVPAHEHSTLLSGFDAQAADVLLEQAGPDSGSPQVLVEMRQLGGAYALEGDHPSAFAHRSAAYSLLAVGIAGMPGVEEHAIAAGRRAARRGTPAGCGRTSPRRTTRRRPAARTTRRPWPGSPRSPRTYDPQAVLQAGSYIRA